MEEARADRRWGHVDLVAERQVRAARVHLPQTVARARDEEEVQRRPVPDELWVSLGGTFEGTGGPKLDVDGV